MEASSTESTEEETDTAESSKSKTDGEQKNGKPDKAEKSDSKGKSDKSEKDEESDKSEGGGYLQPKRLTLAEAAGMVAALLFVLTLFLPWYGTSSTNRNSTLGLVDHTHARLGDTATAWQTFPILRWILLAAAIAPFVLAWIVMRQHKLDWKPGEVTMVVGIAAFVLVLCNGVILGRPGDSVDISLQWGYPIALVTCAGMAVSGFLRQAKHADAKKPPGVM